MLWLISLMSVLLRSRPFGGSERAVVLAISFVISPTEGLFTLRSFQADDFFFFFQAEDGIRDIGVTGVQTCALPIWAVLVGGGELHDRWSSLVGVASPLSAGIQRFTGISQAMVDEAPPPEAVLPELGRMLRGRVLVAHSAGFDLGVLRAAFSRAALDWPEPPVLCTVAMARRFAPLQRRRGLASLADALGVEVTVTHRALPDAETCARVFCALFGRLIAHAGTVGEAVALLGPR